MSFSQIDLSHLGLLVAMFPCIAGLIAGLWGRQIGKTGAHTVTIIGVTISFLLSLVILQRVFYESA